MFERLAVAIDEALAGFDPGSVPLPAAAGAWAELDRLERRVAGAKLLLSGRVAESEAWRRAGHRSPAEHLAAVGGTSVGAARGALDASRQLRDLPDVERAVRSGALSAPQAVAVTDAAAVAPGAQDRLLAAAGRRSLHELREECARTKAAALPDADARHAAVHRSRHLRQRSCADGAVELTYRSTPDEAAEVRAVAQAYADRAFRAARTAGLHAPAEAYLADGLLAAARAANARSSGTALQSQGTDWGAGGVVAKQVIVRIDWDALVRGWPIDGEVSEIPGVGPVPVSLVEALINSGDAFLSAVVTVGDDVVNSAHLGRRPTATQRTALLWHDPICAADGCSQRVRLEVDHVIPWAASKVTMLRHLQWLCRFHHDQKTVADRQGAHRPP